MSDKPTIAIIGAGAVGGYYGGRLAEHGEHVHFLMRSDFAHVRANGLKIRSVDGDFELPVNAIHVYDDPHKMPKADLVIVTLKSTENRLFDGLIAPLLHESTEILTLQNGLGNEDELARLFGRERVIGGIAFVCINRTGPGRIEHLDSGYIRIGDFAHTGQTLRVERLAAMFNASKVSAQAMENLRQARWEKLVWNIPFNGLGAVRDLTTDRLIDTPKGIEEVLEIMREVVAAAAGDGVTLPADVPEKKVAATRSMGAYRTSTQVDRQQGKPMELQAIFGHPLRLAESAGIPTPRMKSIYQALLKV